MYIICTVLGRKPDLEPKYNNFGSATLSGSARPLHCKQPSNRWQKSILTLCLTFHDAWLRAIWRSGAQNSDSDLAAPHTHNTPHPYRQGQPADHVSLSTIDVITGIMTKLSHCSLINPTQCMSILCCRPPHATAATIILRLWGGRGVICVRNWFEYIRIRMFRQKYHQYQFMKILVQNYGLFSISCKQASVDWFPGFAQFRLFLGCTQDGLYSTVVVLWLVTERTVP